MQLSGKDQKALLEALNEGERLRAFRAMIEEPSDERQEWLDNQNSPWDTSFARLRRTALTFIDEIIKPLKQSEATGGQGMSQLVEAIDFYFHTGDGLETGRLPKGLKAPLAAYLVLDTVFDYDFAAREWQTRPWLGRFERERNHEYDPLLQLPYSRKYDYERAERAERQGQRTWESLCRAADLVGIVEQRVARVDIPRGLGFSDFSMPEWKDVQDELAKDDWAIADGTIPFQRAVIYELVRLSEQRDSDGQRRPIWPGVAEGGYEGVLLEGQALSGASKKKLVLEALENLHEAVFSLLYPRSDEEEEAREDELREWRVRFYGDKTPKRDRASSLAG